MIRQLVSSAISGITGLLLFVSLVGIAHAAGAPAKGSAPQRAAVPPGKAPAQQGQKLGSSMEGEAKKFKVGGKVKDKKELDFNDASIDGSAKAPPGLGLGARDGEMPSDFVKIRYHWHDQMISSTSGFSH